MDKAYDIKDLVSKVEKASEEAGLTLAKEAIEKTAIAAVAAVVTWLEESAQLSATPIDNVLAPLLEYLKPVIEAEIQKLSPPSA